MEKISKSDIRFHGAEFFRTLEEAGWVPGQAYGWERGNSSCVDCGSFYHVPVFNGQEFGEVPTCQCWEYWGEDEEDEPKEYEVVCPHCETIITKVWLTPNQASHWQGEWCCGNRDATIWLIK